jgi:hypothetical protein
MKSVDLQLPSEILSGLELEPDVVRGPSDIAVVIDGINMASSLVTLASVCKALPALARRIRSWRGDHHQGEPTTPILVVSGPGISVEVPLPPNVSAQTILDALAQVIDQGNSASAP